MEAGGEINLPLIYRRSNANWKPKRRSLMVQENEVPDFTKPVDIQAFLYNEFGACGCSDLEAMINVVKCLLEWMSENIMERQGYEKLFNGNEGVFYLLAGRLDSLGLSEHGTSIRCAWLTEKGKEFLSALQTITAEQIENCEGEAYDGISYGYGG